MKSIAIFLLGAEIDHFKTIFHHFVQFLLNWEYKFIISIIFFLSIESLLPVCSKFSFGKGYA